MPNHNSDALYAYFLQQSAAESYLEIPAQYQGLALEAALALGTNRQPHGSSINNGYNGYTRLTDTQITEFIQKFEVRHQWSDDATQPAPTGAYVPPLPANTGFSATLLYDKALGSYTLAMRSTEFRSPAEGGDAQRDVWGADVREVSMAGFSLARIGTRRFVHVSSRLL